MRQVVVDASVSAKWVVEEDHSAKAALLLQCDARHAPDHWLAEAINVLWSKAVRGELTAADMEERTIALLRAPVTRTRDAWARPRPARHKDAVNPYWLPCRSPKRVMRSS